MQFGMLSRVDSANHVLDGGAHWCNLANTIESSVCGGDTVFFIKLLWLPSPQIPFGYDLRLPVCIYQREAYTSSSRNQRVTRRYSPAKLYYRTTVELTVAGFDCHKRRQLPVQWPQTGRRLRAEVWTRAFRLPSSRVADYLAPTAPRTRTLAVRNLQ